MGNICNVEPLQAKETKLEGYAPELTAAKAFSLLNNSPISNNSPYLFKKSGSVGLERLKDIVGASYVNNQLVDTNTTSVTIASGHKYVAKISGTLSVGQSSGSAISVTGGTDTFTDLTQLFGSASIADYIYSLETATAGAGISKLKDLGFDFSAYRAYDAGSIVSVNTSGIKVVGKNRLSYDNFVNGKSLNNNGVLIDYPARFSTASPIDVSIFDSVVVTYKFNISSKTLDFIYCLYDENDTLLSRVAFKTSGTVINTANAAKLALTFYEHDSSITVTTDNIVDAQVEASSTATPYEPYTEKTTPLSPIDLRGIYHIDTNNNIYADGDEYKPSGSVSKRFDSVNLGTLTWTYQSSGQRFVSNQISDMKYNASWNGIDSLSTKYDKGQVKYDGTGGDKIIGIAESRVYIRDTAYTDATTFKNTLNGVYLLYEKATPTAETAKPFPEYINIYPYGTEEFLDTRALPAPVGHDSDDYVYAVTGIDTELSLTSVNPVQNKVITNLLQNVVPVYGFHISSAESDPASKVTYLADTAGYTPAHMDYTNNVFDYGSWRNAWFMPKPCMVKQDGTVDYYLNENDYTKKADGAASDIANTSYNGNAMMEWAKIYMKIVPDVGDAASFSVYFSPLKLDADYHAYPYIDANGEEKEHFYTAIYNSKVINDVARSLSGQTGAMKSKTAADARTALRANNASGQLHWDMESYAERMLITNLLILISKTTDSQTAFGQGITVSGSEAINDAFTTGVHNTKGLFYGTNSGTASTYTNAVKVFGMENYYAFQWRLLQGLVINNGVIKTKLCYKRSDGSTADDYSFAGTGYVTGASLSTLGDTDGQCNKVIASERGFVPYCASTPTASASTYYCDYHWINLSIVSVPRVGGAPNGDVNCGLFYFTLGNDASFANWNISAALSCR